jgi:tetratricopeptide (TPR) repeat protein
MLGRVLNDRYRLDAELGRGGMGVVYRGHDALLDRAVAVKVLSEAELGTEGRARLLVEAQSVAKLNHPNVVSIYDAGQADDLAYIVIELVEGSSLHDRRPESLEETLSITRQVCAALEHAHSHDIIHRDLKPENVLLARDGSAKLTDFGLARSVASRLTSEGTVVGTVFYLAPELALGQELDGRADLYALGVMLYELVTGRLPFLADDPVAVISQHLHAPVVPPRARNPEVPVALEALIVQLLAKAPEGRPASATEVRLVLERLAAGEAAPPDTRAVAEELSMLDRIVRGRLVARERELAEARALWRKAIAGEGQVLLVSGEPGIGKTRLVRELVTQAQISGNIALVGESYATGGAHYAPFAQILRRSFENKVCDQLELPDFVLADLVELAPSLRLRYPDIPPNPPLDPESEQQRLFENLVAFCAALSERAPLMLVLEDAHWSDSGTLSLLRHLARRTRRRRVLIAATYREVELDEMLPFQEVLLDLNRERLATRLRLSRLSQEGTRDLLAALFDEEITPEFLEGIYRETEGNPFFIEEVCKALVDREELYFADGRWHRPSMEDLQIPQSVRVAIQSRVGKLPPECQNTLTLAAILGREFEFEVLAEACAQPLGSWPAHDEDALIEVLECAERAQLIEEASGQREVSFTFTHALIPATLVGAVRTLRRRRLHSRAAAAIETLYPDDESRLEALAYHYGEAGDEEQAQAYYTRAGDCASSAYANQEAERHYQAALDLADAPGEQGHLLWALGRVQARLGRSREAITALLQAIEIYKAQGNPDMVARLYARAARAADKPLRGLALCREGMAAVAGAPESRGIADLHHATARACLFAGLVDEAGPLCRRALEMAKRVDAVDVQADAQNTLALLPGQPIEQVLAALTQAVELAESAGLLAQAARAHNNLALFLHVNVGDLTAAREHMTRAAHLSRQRGAVATELFHVANALVLAAQQGLLAQVEEGLPALRSSLDAIPDPGAAAYLARLAEAMLWRYRGNLAEAIEQMQALRTEGRTAGDVQIEVTSGTYLGEALMDAGQDSLAEDVLEETIAVADRGSPTQTVFPHVYLGMIRIQQGSLADARNLLSRAREKKTLLGSGALDEVGVWWAEAHLAQASGHWVEALAAFESAATTLTRMGVRWYHARVLGDWAQAHASRGEPGDRERARELLAEAQREFKEIGAPFYAAQMEDYLASLSPA